jgi:hypothetical protein
LGFRVAKTLNDPKHWRVRAEEARVHAEQIADQAFKKRCAELLRTSRSWRSVANNGTLYLSA